MEIESSISSSPATELKIAKQMVRQLGETLENFQMHAFSVLSLSEQWQNMESTFAMAEASMAARERKLESNKREITHIEKKVENLLSHLKLQQDKLSFGERSLQEKLKEVEMREKDVQECRAVLELEEGEIKVRRKAARRGGSGGGCDGCRVLKEEREKEVVFRRKADELREKEMKERENLLELWEKEIDKKSGELEKREREISERWRELEEREKGIVEIDELRKRKEEAESREKMEVESKAGMKERRISELCKEMEMTQVEMEAKFKSLGAEISGCLGMPELVEMETDEGFDLGRNVSRRGVEFRELEVEKCFEKMDAERVMLYLIEGGTEDGMWGEKLLEYLRLAPDPALLVLEVIRGFHGSGLGINSVGGDRRIGCVHLLEQLMKLEPEISVCVRTEAEKFAADWRTSVVKEDCSPFEVYCFLQFTAAFRLYDADELLLLFQAFYNESEVLWSDQNPRLCHAMALSKKIRALIQSLILKEKYLQAVLYVCAFKLEDAFSPKPLLDAHLGYIRKRANEKAREAREASDTAKDDAAKMEITALRTMLKCISYVKLESSYPTTTCARRIVQLEEEIGQGQIVECED